MSDIKRSTYIAGLKVARDPHYTLSGLYSKIFRALENLPEKSAYRKYTEEIICQRMRVLNATEEPGLIESRINCGQVEELIKQAEGELFLARKMLTWKPWEPLLKEPPPNQWTWPPKNQKMSKPC